MFERLRIRDGHTGPDRTEAVWEDDDMGLRYVFHFHTRDFGCPKAHSSTQVLSRVFAIPQKRMAGRTTPRQWSDSLRWHIVAAEQHLPIPIPDTVRV